MEQKKNVQEIFAVLQDIYENFLPFDRLLGVKVVSLTPTDVKVRIDMREELIGNFVRRILHGGVISSVLDLTGGLIASVELLKNLDRMTTEEMGKRLMKLGTIDLRVDYLRGGEGEYFIATGAVLRKGNKVAVVRTELCNDQDLLIAAGTGTYLVG